MACLLLYGTIYLQLKAVIKIYNLQDDKSFTADFSKVVFVNSSGTVTGRNSAPFTIQGSVDVHSEKIRIKIGNYTYAK